MEWIVTDSLHVVPLHDWWLHLDSDLCWCNPTPKEDCNTVKIHHSMDGREKYETGELKLH